VGNKGRSERNDLGPDSVSDVRLAGFVALGRLCNGLANPDRRGSARRNTVTPLAIRKRLGAVAHMPAGRM
jgi:hypothetical protein